MTNLLRCALGLMFGCLGVLGASAGPAGSTATVSDDPLAAAASITAPSDHRVLIVSVDGLRPDLLIRAETPEFHRLIEGGAYTFWAQTTEAGITLPSHTSMVTGVPIETHGIFWNGSNIPANIDYRYPRNVTLFELAHAAGYSTALVAGKDKLDTLAKPGSVDWLKVPTSGHEPNKVTTAAAVEVIREHRPQVMLFHLADTDAAGHKFGWGSHEQEASVRSADASFGQVRKALEAAGVWDQTLVILTADHGGFGKTHHGRDARGLHIPWVAFGPGVKADHDLTQEQNLQVRTYDTFATACAFLKLPLPPDITGRVVTEAFDELP